MVARAFVPSCPPGMSEPMFASLLFDKAFCMVNLVYLTIVRHTNEVISPAKGGRQDRYA